MFAARDLDMNLTDLGVARLVKKILKDLAWKAAEDEVHAELEDIRTKHRILAAERRIRHRKTLTLKKGKTL